MIKGKRIVVTGLGAVSSVGIGVDTIWESLTNGKSGIAPVSLIDTDDYKVKIAGEVKDFDGTQFGFTAKETQRYDRYVQLGVAAANQAIKHSGIRFENRGENDDICVIMGSGIGGIRFIENTCKVLFKDGPGRVTPLLIPGGTPDVTSHTVAMHHGLHGASFGINSACASGNEALITAVRRLVQGPEVVAIAGGSEAPICRLGLSTFANMKALSTWDGDGDPTRVSRPFDKDRSGFVIAEGSGVLIFEALEHAKARNAKILAEVVGCGQTTDAYHMTAPEPTGKYVTAAIHRVLQDGEILPESVDYINAHGTSTKYNDITETRAIKTVFGEHSYKLCVSSIKSMTGHMIGGCGGFEAIACIKSIETGIVPPTINLDEPDVECDLNYVANTAQERKINVAVSNNFGFGGHNSVIAFKKFID